MSSLPLIIVNPASAGGATGDAWPGVASALRRHFGPFNVEFTRRGGAAVEIAEREGRAGRSFGMGGDVIRRVKEGGALPSVASRTIGGKLSFAAAVLQTALAFEKPTVRVTLDGGRESQLTVTNFCVANARYFGGGMKIAPKALLDDGLFDVVAVGDMSALSVLANSYRVYLGTHLGMRDVRHARTRRIEARPASDDVVKLETDGELVGRLPATFEILPNALRVRCPRR